MQLNKIEYAVLKYVDGNSVKNSMLSWAGKPFQTYTTEKLAEVACRVTNEFYKENNLPYTAFVSKGTLTDKGWS